MSRPVKFRMLNNGPYTLHDGTISGMLRYTTVGKVYDATWKDEGEPDGVDLGGTTNHTAVEFHDDRGHHLSAHFYPDRMELLEE